MSDAQVPQMPAICMRVHIDVEKDEPNDDMVQLIFEAMCPALPAFKWSYTVHSPLECPVELWHALAAGVDTALKLYMGNGDGYIRALGGVATFVAAPSGAGGDVSEELAIHGALFA